MTGTAAGSITPLSFVVQNTSTDNQYILATGTSTPIAGISGRGTRRPPGDFFNDDGNIAISGENFQLFAPPMEEAELQLGGTVAAGDLLTSDGSGHGITTTTTAQQIGARAKQAGVSGQIITVQPLWGPYS
jgi:hypothetical protein